MVNKVILIGNVGADPDVKSLQNDVKVATIRMATNEYFRDGNKHTEWHTIVAWRGLAELAEKYIKKGTMVYVEGRIRRREYNDKEGNKRYSFEIMADIIRLLSKTMQDDTTVGPSKEPTADDFIAEGDETPGFDQDVAGDDDDLPF